MGEKDKLARRMIQTNKVFADIINLFVFQGRQVVKEDELEDLTPNTVFIDEEQTSRELVRDVFKSWGDGQVVFSLLGVEAQSAIDVDMPIRVLAYDALAYREQIYPISKGKIAPVVSLVLYFGRKPWDKNLSLRDRVDVPAEFKEELSEFVYDAKIRVCAVSQLSLEQIRLLRSDLKAAAALFYQDRYDLSYEQMPEDLRAIRCDDATFVRALLNQFTNLDVSTEELMRLINNHEPQEGIVKVNDFITATAERNRMIGREEGRQKERERYVAQLRESALRLNDRQFSSNEIAEILGVELELVKQWLQQNEA